MPCRYDCPAIAKGPVNGATTPTFITSCARVGPVYPSSSAHPSISAPRTIENFMLSPPWIDEHIFRGRFIIVAGDVPLASSTNRKARLASARLQQGVVDRLAEKIAAAAE